MEANDFDPETMFRLPNGNWTARRGPPCREHDRSLWVIIKYRRKVENESIDQFDVWCSECLGARRIGPYETIGSLDRSTGEFEFSRRQGV